MAAVTTRPQVSPAASTTFSAHLLAGSVTVKPGDTLSKIAKDQLGSSGKWRILYWDNRHTIHNPDVITAGQRLRYGSWRTVRPWLRRRSDAAAVMPRPAPVHPAAAPAPASSGGGSMQSVSAAPGSFQQCVISRESGGNPQAVNPSSGAGGLYQFLPSTWQALGFSGLPQDAPVSVQNQAFQEAYARWGAAPWAPSDGC